MAPKIVQRANGRNGSKAVIPRHLIVGIGAGKIAAAHDQGMELGGRYVCRTELAETEGFEPSVRESPVRRFSKPLVSATHPRLRVRPPCRKSGLYKRNSEAST